MAANLMMNVQQALDGMPVTGTYGWLDSTVVLQWSKGEGEYKQFVANRVRKIQDFPDIIWRHADLRSRGGQVTGNLLWWKGPPWLTNQSEWARDIVTTDIEAKPTPKRQEQCSS
jgi:hypothetical protein